MVAKRVFTRVVQGRLWAMGRPSTSDKFANIVRACIAAGCDESQAQALANLALDAANNYTWKFVEGQPCGSLHRATQLKNAALHPHGKDAEDLRAAKEGRESRWGKPEFHSQLCAEAAAD